ncbi:nucleoside hydrolase [Bifidobacterium sp. 82T24]|uniref:nucleoside hydrolase n=1 Tax=Bifidobacterium pluvialisilvae TaxID=2834436 RepID=UPI001C5918DB|nr:nucleoside hydrolase [Bifidobacterium pluvialisilvae]MBW3088561.1 nucleoside hydrolase [Bifidobacterium pluvialisilvae]
MTTNRTAPRPVYFDCDTGIDDSLALAYLMAAPDVRLVGVGTVAGNTNADQAARNSLDLLALGGHGHVPVAVGARGYRVNVFSGGVPAVHGANGVGDVDLPVANRAVDDRTAVDLLIALSHEHAGALHIVAVGPLTNLAAAVEADPTLPDRIAGVWVMGGAALVPGNISPVTEANIGHDPEAAQIALAAGWDVTVAPLDVTMAHTFEETHRQALLASANPAAVAVGRMLDFYFDFHVPEYGRRCSALHDPTAAALCAGGITPAVAPAVSMEVDTTHGPGRGQLICDLRGQRQAWHDRPGARTRVVLRIDDPVADHLVDVLTR